MARSGREHEIVRISWKEQSEAFSTGLFLGGIATLLEALSGVLIDYHHCLR